MLVVGPSRRTLLSVPPVLAPDAFLPLHGFYTDTVALRFLAGFFWREPAVARAIRLELAGISGAAPVVGDEAVLMADCATAIAQGRITAVQILPTNLTVTFIKEQPRARTLDGVVFSGADAALVFLKSQQHLDQFLTALAEAAAHANATTILPRVQPEAGKLGVLPVLAELLAAGTLLLVPAPGLAHAALTYRLAWPIDAGPASAPAAQDAPPPPRPAPAPPPAANSPPASVLPEAPADNSAQVAALVAAANAAAAFCAQCTPEPASSDAVTDAAAGGDDANQDMAGAPAGS